MPWRARQGSSWGLLLALSSALGFAVLPILTKAAYGAGASLLTVLSYRFLIAAALLWLLVRLGGPHRPLTLRLHASLLGLGVAFTLTALTMFVALERVSASVASLIFYTYPTLVTIGAFLFFRERLSVLRVGLVALSLAGCGLIFGVRSLGVDVLSGGWMALASAIAYTIYILAGHRLSHQVAPILTSAYVVTIAALCFTAAAAASGALVVALPARAWIAITLIALLATTIALHAFLTAMTLIGPSRAALVSTLEPVITVALAAVILHEQLDAVQYIGGALIVGAVIGLRLEEWQAGEGRVPAPKPTEDDGRG